MDEMGCGVSRPGTPLRPPGLWLSRPRAASRPSATLSATLDLHLVVVREDEGVGAELQPLHGVAMVPADRVGGQDLRILDELRPRQTLEHGIDLPDVQRPPEGPAVALGSAAHG